MFQIQGQLKTTAQFYNPPSPLSSCTFQSEFYPPRVFSGASAPISPRSCISEQVTIVTSPVGAASRLLRTQSQWSNLGQGWQSPRLRTTRIFARKRSEDYMVVQNKSPVDKNFKIVNYGPIQVTCQRFYPTEEKKTPQKYSPSSTKSPQTKWTSPTRRFPNVLPITKIEDEQKMEGRYHDASQQTEQNINKSYTQTLQPQTDQSSFNTTMLQSSRHQSVTGKGQKMVTFNSVHTILDSKIMDCSTYNQENSIEEKMKPSKIKVEREDGQVLWVWVACFVCMAIIAGLLACS